MYRISLYIVFIPVYTLIVGIRCTTHYCVVTTVLMYRIRIYFSSIIGKIKYASSEDINVYYRFIIYYIYLQK